MAANIATSTARRKSTGAQAHNAIPTAVTRYSHSVIGGSVREVVQYIGGWLVDRVFAGWDVAAYVPADDDMTALQILGVTPRIYTDVLSIVDTIQATAISVSVDAMRLDTQAQVRITTELRRSETEITLWGEQIPETLNASFHTVPRVPSTAAQAFKAHALRAAACDVDCPSVEQLHIGMNRTLVHQHVAGVHQHVAGIVR